MRRPFWPHWRHSDRYEGSRFGTCEIVELLARGGMGAVYLARDHRLTREVAIKILDADLITHGESADRLLHEARSAARLDHPNICTVYEVVSTDTVSFVVMERVEGRRVERVRRGASRTVAGGAAAVAR